MFVECWYYELMVLEICNIVDEIVECGYWYSVCVLLIECSVELDVIDVFGLCVGFVFYLCIVYYEEDELI